MFRFRMLALVGSAACLFFVEFVFAQSKDDTASAVHCHALSIENYTCAHCIQLDPKCAWCSAPGYDDNNARSRCDTVERLRGQGCMAIEAPPAREDVLKNAPLSNAQETEDESTAVLLQPQEISIQVRPNQRFHFGVTFRQAVDYPVDLYYLMDLSRSMEDDKNKLVVLGDAIAERMRAITRNFRLGFGSFVDKNIVPFVDARQKFADAPCATCVPPYGFQHKMRLNKDTRQFAEQVSRAEISGNLDAPEGGFDAIMQALVCNDAIGWRNKSRKMIVFSTDAGFHFAGDGRLGGIVVPNDRSCHLDSSGNYTESLNQDYPSVAQLHHQLKEMKANIIFAVTEEQIDIYNRLQGALPDVGTSVGALKNDSSNIVNLIEDNYRKISGKIVMVDDAPDPIQIGYRTKCLGNRWNDTNVCTGIKVDDEVFYNISLEVTRCPEKRQHTIRIGPSDLPNILTVHLTVLCDCDCEKSRQVNHPKCEGKGDLVCGVCECHGGRLGRHCECGKEGKSTAQMDAQCRKGNDTRAPLCEGRGHCECGRCKCFTRDNPAEKIDGRFCECDNYNCPRHNRMICNGRGQCSCQQCVCEEGWKGRACECPTNEDACVSSNGKICNEKGNCQCGVCKCYTDEKGIRYSGPTCEQCPTCPSKCVELKNCAECLAWDTGPLKGDKCDTCDIQVVMVDELPSPNKTHHCQGVDENDCTFYYAFFEDDRGTNNTVWVKKEKRCPPPVPVLAIVLGVIAGIVIIGLLLLLLWKILTMLHDRREYAKFIEDQKMCKWDTGENPIFNPATSTFRNPAYSGKNM